MMQKISTISFKSTPIRDVKLKKHNGSSCNEFVDAVFSRLNPKCKEDKKAIEDIAKSWGKWSLSIDIANDFALYRKNDKKEYYAVELKGDDALENRIVALCEATPSSDSLYINMLESKSSESKKEKNIKGAGEVMIYGVVQEAKRKKHEKIELDSFDNAVGFYKHIGFVNGDPNDEFYMIMPSEYFAEYISGVERKYNFQEKKYLNRNYLDEIA